MRIQYVKYFSILALYILICSCGKEWLDEKPSQSIATPGTLKDFQAMLDNTSKMNGFNSPLGVAGDDNFYVPQQTYLNLSGSDRNAYTWTYNNPYLSSGWNDTYKGILYCNIVLEGIDKLKLATDAERKTRDEIKGNASFHRAFLYYSMTQVWVPPYNEATAAQDLSIPLRTSSDINIPSVRSTVKETYDLIISDLKTALELSPTQISYVTRSSQPAIRGLLARIYLSMEKYEEAGKYADDCLKLKSSLLNFNSFNTAVTANQIPQPRINPEMIYSNSIDASFSIITPLKGFVNENLFNQYETNDLRRTFLFRRNADNTKNFIANYSTGVALFNGIATDEIYLIRAECLARQNKLTEAMADLNALLSTRYKTDTYIPKTTTSQDEALFWILKERNKELLFRTTRWSDLRRLNKDPRFVTTLARLIGTETFTLEPNSYKYTFPIPDHIIAATGIVQNTGWVHN